MKDLSISTRIDICVAEKDYDKCYDYLQAKRMEIADFIMNNFDCTIESYLD